MWTKAVVLSVVPALSDVAEETHDFVLDIGVLEANVCKKLRRHVTVVRDASVRGSGGKNVFFSNGPNSTSECFNLLY